MTRFGARTDEDLVMYVVYSSPTDYPGKFVVRRQFVGPKGVSIAETPDAVVDTLEEAHLALQPDTRGLVCLGRHPQDEPQIVEVWV